MPITPKRNLMFRTAGDPWEHGFGGRETNCGRRHDGCEMTSHPLLMHKLHQSIRGDERNILHEDAARP
jgi:hypothetical protein